MIPCNSREELGIKDNLKQADQNVKVQYSVPWSYHHQNRF